MTYRSFDPYRQLLVEEFPSDDTVDVSLLLLSAERWRSLSLNERSSHFNKLSELMTREADLLAELITEEMGKPLTESLAELRKCISAIGQLQALAPAVLHPRPIASEAMVSRLLPEPFGPLLVVMPWNFPFWQVIRFSVPSLLAGNTIVLKHAPNVPRCAMAIASLFERAGFPKGVFTNLFLSNEGVARLISSPVIAGVAFTGSDSTGSLIAATAGKHIKKVILELGGNDPLIVFDNADMETAAGAAVLSRCINGGQACIGAKRFLVQASVHDRFVESLIRGLAGLTIGDPKDPAVSIGPIARFDLLEKIQRQVNESVQQGARVAYVSETPSAHAWFYPPTLLTGIRPGMTAFEEEIFGPVWSVTAFRTREEAVDLANRSRYGLGASVWTSDDALIDWIVPALRTGNVFVNDFVRSDPRFPFGGVKSSGFGKELGEAGFLEFVNWKTVYRKH